jgi:F-type H+-transporting ATPase subunit delta
LSSKSTFSNSTSKSYALAFYELANENSALDQVEKEMISFIKLLNESLDFKKVLINPMITKEDKENVLLRILKQNNYSEDSKKFLSFVASKNRLFFLDKIIESFLNLVSIKKGELKAELISSKDLTAPEQEKIKNELSESFKSSLNIDYKYDPNLIGGLIIKVGSVMVDTSIKTKLKKLEQNMVEI